MERKQTVTKGRPLPGYSLNLHGKPVPDHNYPGNFKMLQEVGGISKLGWM